MMWPRAPDGKLGIALFAHPAGYFAFLVFFAFGPLFLAALFVAALFSLAALFLAILGWAVLGLAVLGLVAFDLVALADLGAALFAGAPAAVAGFGSTDAAAGSASLDGAAFAGALPRAASAFWRASASAKRASRKARI